MMQWTATTCADGHTAENVARNLQIDPKYAEAIEREYAYGSTVMQECRWELADAQGIRKRKRKERLRRRQTTYTLSVGERIVSGDHRVRTDDGG